MQLAALVAAFFAAGVFMVFMGLAQRSQTQAVMRERLIRATQAANPALNRPFYERMLHPLGNYLRGRTEVRRVRGLQNRLNAAGRPYGLTVQRLLALKAVVGVAATILFAIAFVALGVNFLVFPPVVSAVLLAVLFGLLGYFAPDIWLGQAARDRRAAIRSQLPDVCDLLSIFIDAGAAFDHALQQLVESPYMNGPLIDELEIVVRNTDLGTTRAEALQYMAERVALEEVSMVVNAVTRSFRLGTRMTDVMRIVSRDVRRQARERAEEQANRAGVKMLFPLVFLIFPCLFLVIMTPALLTAVNAVSGGR